MFGWFRRRRALPEPGQAITGDRALVPPMPAQFLARGRREPERRTVITVELAAAAEIRRAAVGLGRWVVRVRTVVTGFDGVRPTGFQDRVDLDTEVDPEADFFDDSQGVPVAVDRRTADYLGAGAVLDWNPASGFTLRRG
jgi:hypothetical protein